MSKDKTNNIIIGLGGTGGNIINALRKRLEIENKNKDIFVDYLYVDSNSDDLNDKASWKVFGKDVSLDDTNKLELELGKDNINQIFNNPDDFSNITNWLGTKEEWSHIVENFATKGRIYGQQKRRLGRFLFAFNVQDFRDSIRNIVANLKSKSDTVDNTFYICSGLAGGTGSGSLIDTIVQVKELFPNSTILLYLFIPEGNLVGTKDTGNYYPNAYAALKELNDLAIGKWKPYNVFDGEKTEQTNFFKKACIITDENSKGVFLNPEQQKPEKLLADYIFYRVVSNAAYVGRVENSENIHAGAEIVEDDKGRSISVRSRDFMTFGMSRIIFPKEEIKEYLTYKASYSLILSMLYNNWNDTKKIFEDTDKKINIQAIIDDGFKSSIKFTEEVFTLQDGVLENEKYKPFRDEWKNRLENIERAYSESNINVKEKFNDISEQLNSYYDKSFRGKKIGVENFFTNAESDAEKRAKGIVKLLEDKLFNEWLYLNNYSIKNCVEVVERFIELTKKHIKNLDKKIADTEKSIDFFFDEAEAHRVKFEQIGFLGNIVGKREKIYSSYRNALVKYYIAKTELKALNYAKVKLLPFVSIEFNALLEAIKTTDNSLSQLKKDLKDNFENKLKQQDTNDITVKVFDKSLIETTLEKEIINNRQTQENLKTAIQTNIRERVGKDIYSFGKFNEEYDTNKFLTYLENDLSEDIVKKVQNNKNILEKNIIDELNSQYANKDDKLKELVKDTLNRTNEFLPLNKGETNRKPTVTPDAAIQDMISAYLAIIPFSSEESINNNFRAKLKNTFDAKKAGRHMITHVVDQHYKSYNNQDSSINQNEILIVKVTSTFPLRMVERVKFLKDKYVEAHKKNQNIDMEIHIEGKGDDYNDLFIPDRGDYQEKSIVDLLILLATENLLKDDSGEYILDIRNEKGRVAHKIKFLSDKIINLHKNLKYVEALKIKYKSQEIIDNLVKLTPNEKSLEKEKILNNFDEIYNLIEKECNETGEDVIKWTKLFDEVEDKLSKI